MIIRKKYKKLIGIYLLAATVFIFAGCSTNDNIIDKETSTEEKYFISDIKNTPVIGDLSKIENLKNLSLKRIVKLIYFPLMR